MADTGSIDFLSWLGVSDTGRIILQLAANEFEEHGTLITLDALAYEFADSDFPGADLNEVFRLPSVLGGMWSGEQLSLTGLGLSEAGTAPRTVERMTLLAQICAARKGQFRDDAVISRAILEQEYGFEHEDAVRALDLVQKIPGLTGGGNMGSTGRWRFGAAHFNTATSRRQKIFASFLKVKRRKSCSHMSRRSQPRLPSRQAGSSTLRPLPIPLVWNSRIDPLMTLQFS